MNSPFWWPMTLLSYWLERNQDHEVHMPASSTQTPIPCARLSRACWKSSMLMTVLYQALHVRSSPARCYPRPEIVKARVKAKGSDICSASFISGQIKRAKTGRISIIILVFQLQWWPVQWVETMTMKFKLAYYRYLKSLSRYKKPQE